MSTPPATYIVDEVTGGAYWLDPEDRDVVCYAPQNVDGTIDWQSGCQIDDFGVDEHVADHARAMRLTLNEIHDAADAYDTAGGIARVTHAGDEPYRAR